MSVEHLINFSTVAAPPSPKGITEPFAFPSERDFATSQKQGCSPRKRKHGGWIVVIAGVVIAVVLVTAVIASTASTPEEAWCRDPVDRDFIPNTDGRFAFASYYQTHMVLQREPHNSIVWGYGTVGATVNISLNAEELYSTKVVEGHDGLGVWSVKVDPHPAGLRTEIQGVHDDGGVMQFASISDILFGDVFVCSGQSNMAMTLSMIDNPCEELEETKNYSDVRVFTVKVENSQTPRYDLSVIEQSWSIPSPDNMVGEYYTYFSAVCWLYGRYLYDELGIPIGLVASSRGASRIEHWAPVTVSEECRVSLGIGNQTSEVDKIPSLFNAMIHPLMNMTIKGLIWYQGESNTIYRADRYQCTFPNMIKTWRKMWYEGSQMSTDPTFPFGFVQIGGLTEKKENYSVIRWHQTADYGYVPNPEMENTFMAVAMDLPDPDSIYGSIHPRYKRDVASRLVAGSLSTIYGRTTVHQGPFPENLTETSDHKIFIQYPLSQQLVVVDVNNFQVCCQDDNCSVYDLDVDEKWRTATIVEYSDHTITINAQFCSDQSKLVDKVRYAWALNPCVFKKCSVYNDEGFPGAPFILPV